MSEKKYELTNETMEYVRSTLHRIRALKDFGDVKKGDLGGFIEKEDNLSQEGNCWVGDDARVYENAKVYGNAEVCDIASVFGNAKIYDNALVADEALVYGDAEIYRDAKVCDYAEVYEQAKVYGRANVCWNAEVIGNAVISTGEISKGTIDGSEKKSIELD